MALTYIPKIKEVARELKIEYEIHETLRVGHATEITENIAKKGEDATFYACGGDGTLNEVFCGAYKYKNAYVSSVPCGSGNDYVKNFGSVKSFKDIKDLIQGKALKVDLVQVNDRICNNITSMGLDANVALTMLKYKNLPLISGKLAYNLAILTEVLKPLSYNFKMKIDDEDLQGKYLLAAVCNGKTYGGGINASRFSNLHDGMLDIIFVNTISKFKIATVISDYKAGTHMESDTQVREDLKEIINYRRCKEITIENVGNKEIVINIDGEILKMNKFSAKVMPSAANFVIPKSVYGVYIYKSGL